MPVQNGKQDKPITQALSSQWDGLSEHLIATFWEVDRQGKRKDENLTVKAPIVDGTFSVSLQWNSPFEGSGIESMQPAIVAMLQSGALQPAIDAFNETGKKFGVQLDDKVKDSLKGFEGRTGITKLNSTQTFAGMPPFDIQCTLFLRAWNNPKEEVMNILDQLMFWSLPQKLADQSTILSRAADYASGKEQSAINILLPSLSPVMVAMNYKGRIYAPLVIESISYDLASPIDKNGDFVSLSIPIKLNSLTAIDRNDWKNYGKEKNEKKKP